MFVHLLITTKHLMSFCKAKPAVPFATLSDTQRENSEDSNFYDLKFTLKQPSNLEVCLEISAISLNFGIFRDPADPDIDPTETVDLKIVSLGKTVIDRTLNAAELLAMFSNNSNNVNVTVDDLYYVNTWDFIAQGCPLLLATPTDVLEITTHTKRQVTNRPISVQGCCRNKHDCLCHCNQIPFIEFSTPLVKKVIRGEESAFTNETVLKCTKGSRIEINRIVLSGPDRFRDNTLSNNYDIAVKSAGLVTLEGKFTAQDIAVLAPFTNNDSSYSYPIGYFQIWNFSCPLTIKSCGDIVDIKVFDKGTGSVNDKPLPVVLLGCQEALCH